MLEKPKLDWMDKIILFAFSFAMFLLGLCFAVQILRYFFAL